MNITVASSAEAEKNQRALGCTTHVPFQKAPTNNFQNQKMPPVASAAMLLEFILGGRDFLLILLIYASKMRHLSKEHCKITQGGH